MHDGASIEHRYISTSTIGTLPVIEGKEYSIHLPSRKDLAKKATVAS